MKILFACGGTAGHINPAIAVANRFKKLYPDAEILFAGNPSGMEAGIVQKAGYRFAPIKVLGIQRRINLRNIRNNFKALWYLAGSSARAKHAGGIPAGSRDGHGWVCQRPGAAQGGADGL